MLLSPYFLTQCDFSHLLTSSLTSLIFIYEHMNNHSYVFPFSPHLLTYLTKSHLLIHKILCNLPIDLPLRLWYNILVANKEAAPKIAHKKNTKLQNYKGDYKMKHNAQNNQMEIVTNFQEVGNAYHPTKIITAKGTYAANTASDTDNINSYISTSIKSEAKEILSHFKKPSTLNSNDDFDERHVFSKEVFNLTSSLIADALDTLSPDSLEYFCLSAVKIKAVRDEETKAISHYLFYRPLTRRKDYKKLQTGHTKLNQDHTKLKGDK